MDPLFIGIAAIVVLIVLIIWGIPIAFTLAIVGIAGNTLLLGPSQAATQLQLIAWETGTNFLLIAIPLFIFMGQLTYHTGLATDMYEVVYKWLGRVPGGVAVTATVTSAGFGAVTGSSITTIATMGSMVMPEMKRYKYDPGLASGSISAAGTLAILIPPSIPMIVYGVWTETSIARLFIAGIIPGVILALLYAGYITGRCAITPKMGPRGPRFTWSDKWLSLVKLLPVLLIFLSVLGGIYGGIVTPTEASAIGCAAVALIALLMGRLRVKKLLTALDQAATITGVLFIVVIGGIFMSRFLVLTKLTPTAVDMIVGLDLGPYGVIAMLVVFYLVLGTFLETFGLLVLTLPFVMPVFTSLGYDQVWVGIFLVLMIEIALITPPVGLNVYVMHRVAPDISLITIFRGSAPFVVITLLAVVLFTLVPELVLWLPAQMMD